MIYASSSSVYGKNSEIPFGRLLKTDVPGNMYAATKSANELLGRLYCELFNISAVGLRLFTVYGPWGRPDMAIYKFTQLTRNGEDIPLYHARLAVVEFSYYVCLSDELRSKSFTSS